MKKLLILFTALAFIAFWTGLALAGEYHSGSQLVCSDCHTMHYSQAHTYTGVTGQGTPPLSGGPNNYLLRQPQNQLCLACHDNVSAIPDVYGTDVNSSVRQAGGLNGTVSGHTLGGTYADWKGHTLGASGTPPGGSVSITALECANCHDTHGNAYWRNLNVGISYQVSTTASNTADVRVDLGSVPAVGSRVSGNFYSPSKIFFNEPGAANSAYGDFCASCHAQFHGTANTGSTTGLFTRHPTESVNFTSAITSQYNGKTNKVQVLFANNASGVTYTTSATPSCMSCHKGHGNQNPFGLIYMLGSGTVTEEGDSGTGMQDLCRQCHNK